jgi:hypothetical protein
MKQTSKKALITGLLIFSLTPAYAEQELLSEAPGAATHKLGQSSGFEGREEQLGKAVAELVQEMSDGQVSVGDRDGELGHYVAVALKTINHTSTAYKHRLNDALVKQTLGHYQFAKDHNLIDEMLAGSIKTESPMLLRVKSIIERTGNRDLALVSLFDQTTCHWQLVHETEAGDGYRRYISPYKEVLEVTRGLGQHDLTEEEIHQKITIPEITARGDLMGVPLEVSPWQEDGVITISIRQEVM